MNKFGIFISAIALAVPSIALAQHSSPVWIRIDFYSDSSLQNPVGEFVQLCDGTSYFNGQITGYSRHYEFEC